MYFAQAIEKDKTAMEKHMPDTLQAIEKHREGLQEKMSSSLKEAMNLDVPKEIQVSTVRLCVTTCLAQSFTARRHVLCPCRCGSTKRRGTGRL